MTKPKIVERELADLKPSPSNARTHSEKQIGQIIASVEEFGWTNPLLIDEKNTVIAGHGRLTAAKRIGRATVPCIILSGLSEVQKRALVIADNKLALNAGWDSDLLLGEIEALDGAGFELSILGFDDAELDAGGAEDASAGSARVHRVDASRVADVFWISISGPLQQQADALDRVRKLMADVPDVTVELGTVQREVQAGGLWGES